MTENPAEKMDKAAITVKTPKTAESPETTEKPVQILISSRPLDKDCPKACDIFMNDFGGYHRVVAINTVGVIETPQWFSIITAIRRKIEGRGYPVFVRFEGSQTPAEKQPAARQKRFPGTLREPRAARRLTPKTQPPRRRKTKPNFCVT